MRIPPLRIRATQVDQGTNAAARAGHPVARTLALGGVGAVIGTTAAYAGMLALREDPPALEPTGGLVRYERSVPRIGRGTDPATIEAAFASDGPGWRSSDVTVSVPLGDGRQLWLFGDTAIDTTGRGDRRKVENSAVVTDGTKLTTLTSGVREAPRSFLVPPDSEHEWYWPSDATREGSRVLVFAERIHRARTGDDPLWNFQNDGTDLVVLDADELTTEQTVPLPRLPGVSWGTAIAETKQHTYVYAMRQGEGAMDREALVARARTGTLHTGELEYWDGQRWVDDPGQIAPIATGVSNVFSVQQLRDGRWALLSQELAFGTKLYARTSQTPHGPWSDPVVIDEPPREEGVLSYNAVAHPQLSKPGELLVAYNRNTGPWPMDEAMDRDYRADFRTVDLDQVGR